MLICLFLWGDCHFLKCALLSWLGNCRWIRTLVTWERSSVLLPMRLNLRRKLFPISTGILRKWCPWMHLHCLWKQIRGLLVPGRKSIMILFSWNTRLFFHLIGEFMPLSQSWIGQCGCLVILSLQESNSGLNPWSCFCWYFLFWSVERLNFFMVCLSRSLICFLCAEGDVLELLHLSINTLIGINTWYSSPMWIVWGNHGGYVLVVLFQDYGLCCVQ